MCACLPLLFARIQIVSCCSFCVCILCMYESERDVFFYLSTSLSSLFLLFSPTIVHIIMCFLSFILLPQTVGISIEFCSHITRWFISCSKKTKRDRAKSALANMGSSVSNPLTCRCTYSTLCTNTLEYNANTSSHEFYINACYAWNLFAKTKFQMCC